MCAPLPLLGEPFNGQLVTEGRSQDEGEEKEDEEQKEDLHGGAPEIFTPESAQTFPIRHPDRFPSRRPDNMMPPQPARRSRDHNWKQLGTTECSTTCGKGEPPGRASRGPAGPRGQVGQWAPGAWPALPSLSLDGSLAGTERQLPGAPPSKAALGLLNSPSNGIG